MAHILVIDDDPMVRTLLSGILKALTHTVVLTANGDEGLKAFRAAKFDLVITDIVMPDKEGISTIRDIRRDHEAIPILAISGSGTVGGQGDYLSAAVSLGATEALRKPIDPERLILALGRLLPLA